MTRRSWSDPRARAAFAVLIGLIGMIAQTSVAPIARADDAPDEILLKEGVELRRRHDDLAALEAFRRAYAQRPTPRARGQIGLAEHALGRWGEAEIDLAEALRAEDDTWIAHNRATLESSLAAVRRRLAWIEIVANVSGAEVTIGGVKVATLPMPQPARVIAGTIVIEVRADGYELARRTVDVAGESHARESFDLVAVAAGPPRAGDPVQPTPNASVAPSGRTPVAPGGSSAAPWIVVASSGALLVSGVVAHVIWQNNAAIYNDNDRCFHGGETRDQRCPSYRDTATTAQWVAVAGYSGSAIAAVIATLLFVERSPAKGSAKSGLHCAPGSIGLGISCATRF